MYKHVIAENSTTQNQEARVNAIISEEDFYTQMRNFISYKTVAEAELIKPDTILISSGILDSLAVTEAILFVENITGRGIEIDDFRLSTFESMSSIYRNYVSR